MNETHEITVDGEAVTISAGLTTREDVMAAAGIERPERHDLFQVLTRDRMHPVGPGQLLFAEGTVYVSGPRAATAA